LLLGFGISTWQAIRANQERHAADRARIEAVNAKDQAEKAEIERSKQLAISTHHEAEAETAREAESAERAIAERERDKATTLSQALTLEKQELSRQKEEQRRMRYDSDMKLVQTAWDASNVVRVRDLLNAHRPQSGEADLRGFEWHYWNRMTHSELRSLKLPPNPTKRFFIDNHAIDTAFDFAGNLVTHDTIWNTQTGIAICTLENFNRNGTRSGSTWLKFDPTGKRLAGSSYPEGQPRSSVPMPFEIGMFDAQTGKNL